MIFLGFTGLGCQRGDYPRDVAEMALAHTIGDKVEPAYRRGDPFNKRGRLMQDWTKLRGRVQTDETVTPIAMRKKYAA